MPKSTIPSFVYTETQTRPRRRPKAASSYCRSTPWLPNVRGERAFARDRGGLDGDEMILDIGPRSIEHVCSVLARVKTRPHQNGLMRCWRADSLCLHTARSRNYPICCKSRWKLSSV